MGTRGRGAPRWLRAAVVAVTLTGALLAPGHALAEEPAPTPEGAVATETVATETAVPETAEPMTTVAPEASTAPEGMTVDEPAGPPVPGGTDVPDPGTSFAPVAAGAIAEAGNSTAVDERYAALGGPAGVLGPVLYPVDCALPGDGCIGYYSNGVVVWSAATGARVIGDAEIYEAWVDFRLELSVVTARSPGGALASYVPVENRHRPDHILGVTVAPADLPAGVAAAATGTAERIAGALGLEGLLAVEMFLTDDGRLLVNELAPRPHNSGHWTIDACAVSQFEQQVRAVCGLPLGDPSPFAAAEMENLIGADAARWPELLAEPGARLHLYGKRAARPGRKMGHVTRLKGPPPPPA